MTVTFDSWEYLVATWEEVAQSRIVAGQAKRIWRPGATEAQLRKETNRLDVLNELGREGSEAVEHSPNSMTVLQARQGFQDVSYPIQISWTFKRRLSEGDEK